MLAVHGFMYFWLMEFIQAFFNYALLTGVCTWYFTSSQDTRGNFSLKQGFWWGFRYNMGSLAFGAFLLAVVWTIKIVFEYINNQVSKLKGKNGGFANSIVNCTRCCIDCFHRFIKFLNDNAYAQMALTGESFCMSAMNACILALKNSGSFFIANGIGALIQSLGKGFISVCNTAIGYMVISKVPSFKEDIDQPIPFLILIFLMSYKMSSAFMDVYSGCSLAIFQCLYADADICN